MQEALVTSKSTLIGIGVLITLVAGLVWWVLSATPTQAAIEAARQPPPPLPSLNLQQIQDGTLQGRTSNGVLPINVEGVGRTDPFAGA